MRVFLTSDAVGLARSVRDLLVQQGHVVEEPTEVGAGALLARTSSKYDAAVAVLCLKRPPRVRRQAVLIEIGIVLGREVPTLLVCRPGEDSAAMGDVSRVTLTGADLSLLDLQLQLFLEGVSTAAPHSLPPSPLRDRSTAAPLKAVGQQSPQQLEQRVLNLLREGGASFANPISKQSDGRPDFLLYMPGFEQSIGLVAIEVKRFANQESARRRLRDAAYNLSKQVAESSATLGLLIYDSPAPTDGARAGSRMLSTYHIADLERRLETESLSKLLLQARNEAVHAL